MRKEHIFSILLLFIFIGYFVYFNTFNKTKKTYICEREMPFTRGTDFEGLINIVYVRLNGNESKFDNEYINVAREYKNCLVVNYSTSSDLGMFYSNQDNSLNALKLTVNNAYEHKYDVFTQLILSHELTHVGQYIEQVKYGKTLSCVDREVYAFKNMLSYFSLLSDNQRKKLLDDLFFNEYPDPTVTTFKQLLDFSTKAWGECNNNDKVCFNRTYTLLVKKFIENSPSYKEQCGLNK